MTNKVTSALQKDGLLTRQQVQQLQQFSGGNVIDFFRTEKIPLEQSIDQYLRERHSLPVVCLDQVVLDPDVVKKLPQALCLEHLVVPFHSEGQTLYVAMAEPENTDIKHFIQTYTGMTIVPYLSDVQGIRQVIRTTFDTTADDDRRQIDELVTRATSLGTDPEAMAKEAPIIQLLDHFLAHAMRLGASDLHLEPTDATAMIRLRIDGLLHDTFTLPLSLHAPLVARIKILASMRIDEHLRPQDARFVFTHTDRSIAVRVSIVPALHGQKVVLRFLSTDIENFSVERLGMASAAQNAVKKMITAPHGLLLVTGPTGSGKTTTLYSMMNELRQRKVNISTIEDPIEYKIPGVTQVQVNPQVGLTFATGLRSLLRQDPDIILVGEIRDRETAEIAIHAALTGHLVLSSLHTNSAAAAVTRLLDIGIEPYLIASTVCGVIGQRLVREICPKCKQVIPTTAWPEQLQSAEPAPTTHAVGQGCTTCLQTGYRGRAGLFEVMPMTEQIQQLVMQRATATAIENAAVVNGMRTLRDDARLKVQQGLTTPQEVIRVLL